MFRVALCDDDEKFLDLEEEIIIQYMEVKGMQCRIDRFPGGQDMLDLGVEADRYQLIFLDVSVGGVSGVEFARKIRERSEVPIAFVTELESYSIEGYRVNAIRYILKEKDDFHVGICECLDVVMSQNSKHISGILEIDLREGKEKIPLNHIVYIESCRHYCFFHILKRGRIHIYKKRERLDGVEERIHDEAFLRIHKSCLVNLSYVLDVRRYQVQLTIGESLMISQPKYLNVEKRYQKYCQELNSIQF